MTSVSYPENSTATVATYAAVEPSGSAITWSTAGDDGDLFSIEAGALNFRSSPDYESPADFDEDNSYAVTVQASDGTETATLDITINVTNVNEAPSVTGETALPYDEQGTGSVATYTGSDPEGDALTWSVSGSDADDFSIEAGVLSFADRPNYEEPSDCDSDNVYDVNVNVSDGTYGDSVSASVTVADIQEVPITNADSQAVVLVRTDGETTIMAPDEVASVTFPSGSRDKPYFVLVDSAQGNCNDDASPDTPDPNDGELQVCLTMSIFDTWGTQEEDVTLDQSASISLMMDAEDSGGVEMVEDAYEEGGFITYIREGVDARLVYGGVHPFNGRRRCGHHHRNWRDALQQSCDSHRCRCLQAVDGTSPDTDSDASTGAASTTLRSDFHVHALWKASDTGLAKLCLHGATCGLRLRLCPQTLARWSVKSASVAPLAPGLVEKVRWWALIVLIIGSIMFATGSGLIAVARIVAPPKWMRVPWAPPIKKPPETKPVTAR